MPARADDRSFEFSLYNSLESLGCYNQTRYESLKRQYYFFGLFVYLLVKNIGLQIEVDKMCSINASCNLVSRSPRI